MKELVEQLASACDRCGVSYVIGGSWAAYVQGGLSHRVPGDVDLMVLLGDQSDSFFALLGGFSRPVWSGDRNRRVTESGDVFDVLCTDHDFAVAVHARAVEVDGVRVATLADLLIFKVESCSSAVKHRRDLDFLVTRITET